MENIAAETAESIVAVCYNQSRCKCLQTESALTSIKVCFVWIPILVYACGLVIMKFYHLDKEFDGIIADLKARAQK